TQELELIEVSKKKVHRGIESFDLLFRGKKENQFTQGTYMINHARMGSFSLFQSETQRTAHFTRPFLAECVNEFRLLAAKGCCARAKADIPAARSGRLPQSQ